MLSKGKLFTQIALHSQIDIEKNVKKNIQRENNENTLRITNNFIEQIKNNVSSGKTKFTVASSHSENWDVEIIKQWLIDNELNYELHYLILIIKLKMMKLILKILKTKQFLKFIGKFNLKLGMELLNFW